ncbi:hypothetical protein N8I74_00145 [Chitiniphilus purpureus]|uniref:DUF2946 domain-containing protein n=1 Tax=Chitiniphilus purpureus TaxID=2981137 RepID=A0ABY6DPQ7_9NEIS|nr:hypothetical protein [Chitiniphilus sp. CD1]UXY15461.1 hypothetical protein N8I74_00145 [Chitiniphilus sp. CD1]
MLCLLRPLLLLCTLWLMAPAAAWAHPVAVGGPAVAATVPMPPVAAGTPVLAPQCCCSSPKCRTAWSLPAADNMLLPETRPVYVAGGAAHCYRLFPDVPERPPSRG